MLQHTASSDSSARGPQPLRFRKCYASLPLSLTRLKQQTPIFEIGPNVGGGAGHRRQRRRSDRRLHASGPTGRSHGMSEWMSTGTRADQTPGRGAEATAGGHQLALSRRSGDVVYAIAHRDPHSDAKVMARGLVLSRGGCSDGGFAHARVEGSCSIVKPPGKRGYRLIGDRA
ncbi:MAG: nitrite reductase (NAD(P)H) small subunit [Aeromicrobium sp.]